MNFTLEITFPDGSRQKKELADLTEVTVGRDPVCTVPLGEGSETASAKHLALRVERNRVLVEDLGSSNGTFLKGQKVTRAELRPGDEIGIGQKGPRIKVTWIAPTVLEGVVGPTTLEMMADGAAKADGTVRYVPTGKTSPSPAQPPQALTHVGSKTVMQMINQAVEASRHSGGLGKGTVFIQQIVQQTVREANRGLRWGILAVFVLLVGLAGFFAYSYIQNQRFVRDTSALVAATVRDNALKIETSARAQAQELEKVKQAYSASLAALETKLKAAEGERVQNQGKITALRSELLTTRARSDEISASLDQTRQAMEATNAQLDNRIAAIQKASRRDLNQGLSDGLKLLEERQKAYLERVTPASVSFASGPGKGVGASPTTSAPAGTVFIPGGGSTLVMKKRIALDQVRIATDVMNAGVSPQLVQESIRAILGETLGSSGRFELVERADLSSIADERALAQKGATAASEATTGALTPAQLRASIALTKLDVESRQDTSPGWGSVFSTMMNTFGSLAGSPGLSRDANAVATGIQKANVQIADEKTSTSVIATVGLSATIRDVRTGDVRTVTAEAVSSSTATSYASVMSTAYTAAVRSGRAVQPRSPLASAVAACSIKLAAKLVDAYRNSTWTDQVLDIPDPGTVVLHAGATAGLREGDTFRVTRKTAPLKDPASGQVVGYNSQPIATIYAEKVEGDKSICRLSEKPTTPPIRGDDVEFIGRTLPMASGETRDDVERKVVREGVPASFIAIISGKPRFCAAPSESSAEEKVKIVQGQVFPILARFGDWLEVRVEDRDLFVKQTAGPEVVGRALTSARFEVRSEGVEAHLGPKATTKKAGSIKKGETVEPLYSIPGWYEVKLASGHVAWIEEAQLQQVSKV